MFSLKLILLGALRITAHTLHPRSGTEICGAPKPTVHSLTLSTVENSRNLPKNINQNLTVDLFIHIVAASENRKDGYITQQELDNQMAVLQSSFEPAGISFNIIGTRHVINTTWATNSTGEFDEMKRALHVGDYRTLNLIFLINMGLYGMCNIPMLDVNITLPDRVLQDGCVVNTETIPGGAEADVNEGKSAVHEIGHWFGLWHTFEGHFAAPPALPDGCVGIGDEVEDTPAQQYGTYGCPDRRDSCPDSPGDDPIHNYMDYSFDVCRHEFTAGQVQRMHSVWEQYRANA